MPVVRDPAQFDRKSGSRLEQLVFNNRLLVLLLCLAATAVLGYFALKLEVNASFERMIPSSSPYIQTYFAYREELPGLGNTVRVVVENKSGDVYDAAYLEKLRKVNDALYLIPGVDRSWMKSLWMPIVRWRQVTEEGVVGGLLCRRTTAAARNRSASSRKTLGGQASLEAWWPMTRALR